MDIYCKVCGMLITNKSLNLNNHALLSQNTEEKLLYCPFCGVSEEYLLTSIREFIKPQILDSRTIKILDHAVKLELFNADFYKKAAAQSESPILKEQFSSLAAIEKMHANIHFKLGNFKERPILADIYYEKYNKDSLLMEQAVLREKHAVAFYAKNIEFVQDSIIRETMEALAKVERDHIKLLH